MEREQPTMRRYWPLLLWLFYFLWPADLLPDSVLGPGWLDDILVLALIYHLFYRGGSPAFRKRRGNTNSAGAKAEREAEGIKDPYDILGASHHATLDEIRKAYRIQAGRYHPDKVNHLGSEFQDLATAKFREIRWAYEEILRNRGVSGS